MGRPLCFRIASILVVLLTSRAHLRTGAAENTENSENSEEDIKRDGELALMAEILHDCLLSHFIPVFHRHEIRPQDVGALTNEDWELLSVRKIGDRAR